jgi:hypothetical protein
MFLRATTRKKDGKEHRYFSVVENRRVSGGRVLQRHVLYLGEINASQEVAWRRSIEVLDEATQTARTLALFPEDRCEAPVADESIVRLQLGLDEFWSARLAPSRKGTRFDQVLWMLWWRIGCCRRAPNGVCIVSGNPMAFFPVGVRSGELFPR